MIMILFLNSNCRNIMQLLYNNVVRVLVFLQVYHQLCPFIMEIIFQWMRYLDNIDMHKLF